MALRESIASVASAPDRVALTTASLASPNCCSSALIVVTEAAIALSALARTDCTVAEAALRLLASALAAVTVAWPSVASEGEAA